jgi:hypothetical protein
MDGEEWPVAGGVLTVLAGLLMLIDGAFEVWLGGVAATSGIPGSSAAGGILSGLGLLGTLIGLIVLVLGIMLYVNPDSHLGYGIAVAVLSALSFFGGGGFLLGIVLGVIGGLLACFFQPDSNEFPWETSASQSHTKGRRCENCGAPMTDGAYACASCHRPVGSGAAPVW